MPTWNATNPVSVGQATTKNQWDRLWDNVLVLKTSISDDGDDWVGDVIAASGKQVGWSDGYFSRTAANAAKFWNGTALGTLSAGVVSLSTGAAGPSLTITNGTRPNYVEFYKSGYTARGAVGLLGSVEMNIGFNMDYADNTHKFYDSTLNAWWFAMGDGGVTLQFAPKGATGDVYNTAGHDPFFIDMYGAITTKSITGASSPSLKFVRTAGTASSWKNYLAQGSTDLSWFPGTDADKMTLTVSGVLKLPNTSTSGGTTVAGMILTGTTAAHLLAYQVGNGWFSSGTTPIYSIVGANTNGWTHTVTGAAAQMVINSGGAFSWSYEASASAGAAYAGTEFMNLSTAGVLKVNNLATGTLTSVSGVITSSSDETMKDILPGRYPYGLAEIRALVAEANGLIRYYWKADSGLPTDVLMAGMGAQTAGRLIPESAARGPNGKWGLTDRPWLGAALAAIDALARRLDTLEAAAA